MSAYWIPPTKRELLIWIKRQYWNAGQCVQGLDKYPKKRLMAIYYSLIAKVKVGDYAQSL